jgi:RNA polymerase sigma-70 factor, ECF subfamily
VDLPVDQQITTLKAGDVTTFEMVFRTFYQPLCNYAYSFVQDRDAAEEIVQSTFLNVWEKGNNLVIHTAVKPYLYAMVRNACLNMIKHEKIKKQHVDLQLAVADRSIESVTHTVMASELEGKIQQAMEKLPQQCRLVFKLSRFEELKYSEIAEHLDISIKTVENQMGKALRIMREELKDYIPLLITVLNGFLNW